MRKFAKGLETTSLVTSLGRIGLASAAMGGLCLASKFTLMEDWAQLSTLARIASLGITIAAGAVVYFALTKMLKVEESGEFLSIVSRRFGKR
jgi:peptidoglycan biosynthesis protein MviN/MurJ (putative lipid II flippase)